MRNHYVWALEKELDRLWVGSNHVMVIKLGKDKFTLSDGSRSVTAKGFEFIRITKRLHDKAGLDKFWRAMQPLKPSQAPNRPIVIESAPVVAGRR